MTSSDDLFGPTPKLWNAKDLKAAAQPRWLARSRIPRGAISLLIGDEGIGKSLMWVWITAAVTTGKPLPEFGIPGRDPAYVIVVVTEDDWSTAVLPRLEVAGADLDMVQVICTEEDGSGAPVFPRDISIIEGADPAPALVVVDAWLDTVPKEPNVRDPQQARQALHPWKDLATTTDAAVTLLTHTNRVASVNARDRYGATVELRKKARMGVYAMQDDLGRLVIGPEKANGTATQKASVFSVGTVQKFEPTDDNDGIVPKLEYVEESNRTIKEYLADSVGDPDKAASRSAAKEYLLEALEHAEGFALAEDVMKDGEPLGFTKRELTNAGFRTKHPRILSKATSEGWVWYLETADIKKWLAKRMREARSQGEVSP